MCSGCRVGDGVVAVLVEALRHAVLEVGVADAQRVRRGVVGEQEGVGVELGDVEGAAGLQEVVDDLGPALEVAEPDERAPGGEDDVEGAGQLVRQARDVALHEGGAPGEADLGGERARRPDALAGEVDAGDDGAAARPAERVEAEVALQVQQRRALADQRAQLAQLDRAERGAARLEAGDVVQLRVHVQPDGLVPAGEVGLEEVVEHRQASAPAGLVARSE